MNLVRTLSAAAISTNFSSDDGGPRAMLLDDKIICRDCQTNYMMEMDPHGQDGIQSLESERKGLFTHTAEKKINERQRHARRNGLGGNTSRNDRQLKKWVGCSRWICLVDRQQRRDRNPCVNLTTQNLSPCRQPVSYDISPISLASGEYAETAAAHEVQPSLSICRISQACCPFLPLSARLHSKHHFQGSSSS